MLNLSNDRLRLIIKICQQYYFENMSQQEISNMLGISRPQVSRMLTLARESGIVNIQIKDPFSEEHKAEQWIIDTFGISNAIIINAADSYYTKVIREMSHALNEFLNSIIKDNCTLGVMAGITLNGISEEISAIDDKKNLVIVPLVGGSGSVGKWQANLNARNFGEKFGCRYLQLNAPTFVASPKTRDVLLSEPEILGVLNAGRNSTIALVGIGQIQKDATIINAGFFSDDDLEELAAKGAAASICNSFLDKEGNVIDFSGYTKMIGLTAEDLKTIPTVIGIAWGYDKVPAIVAALLGKWVDVIVTTLPTARDMMNYYNATYTMKNIKPNRGGRINVKF